MFLKATRTKRRGRPECSRSCGCAECSKLIQQGGAVRFVFELGQIVEVIPPQFIRNHTIVRQAQHRQRPAGIDVILRKFLFPELDATHVISF